MKTYTEDEIKAAIEELDRWLKERGLTITGCGCCGSPSLGYTNEKGEQDWRDNVRVGE